MRKVVTVWLAVTIAFALSNLNACKNPQLAEYSLNTYFSQPEQDTLMVNLVTLMGDKPKGTNWETRHEPQYRGHFELQAKKFQILHYHIAPDSTHYFLIQRPARSPKGISARVTGGYFKLHQELKPLGLVELFCTPILPEDELRSVGRKLFDEMLLTGNVDKYLGNTQYVEWPNGRLRYDRVRNEWRYDVVE